MRNMIKQWSGWHKASLIMVLLLLSVGIVGCTIIIEPMYYTAIGTVTMGPDRLPLVGVEVHMSGPVVRSALTDRNGNYTVSNLMRGTYTVRVETPFGYDDVSYLPLNSDTTYDVHIPFPTGFDRAEFYYMSALWDLYSLGSELGRGHGLGTWRWPSGVSIPLYLDANNHGTPTMVNNAFNYLDGWTVYTGNQVSSTTQLGFRPNTLDRFIQVQWVGAGQIPILRNDAAPGTVGLAIVEQFDTLGYMQKVLVLVDKNYGDVNTHVVFAHELMHVVGAGHSEDPNSLMYPRVTGAPTQRKFLTEQEKMYTRALYYLPPQLKLSFPTGARLMVTTLSSGPSIRTTIVGANNDTEIVAGIPAELAALDVVQEIFGKDVSSAGVGGDMLWDSITF